MGPKKVIHSFNFARERDKKNYNLSPEAPSTMELHLLHMTLNIFFKHVCVTLPLRLQ